MPKQALEARELALRIAELAWEKKATDVAILDVSGLVTYTEYLVILSGRSDRQVQAIADHIEGSLREARVRPLGVEGRTGGRWILMDYGSVIVHVFYEATRAFYDLERLWHDAPRLEVHEPDEPAATAAAASPPVVGW